MNEIEELNSHIHKLIESIEFLIATIHTATRRMKQ